MPATRSSSRRELLGRTALAVSAMALAPHVRGQEAKKKVGFCVVGIGSLAKNQGGYQLAPLGGRHLRHRVGSRLSSLPSLLRHRA